MKKKLLPGLAFLILMQIALGEPLRHPRLRPKIPDELQDLPLALSQAEGLWRRIRRQRFRHKGQGCSPLFRRHRRRFPVPPARDSRSPSGWRDSGPTTIPTNARLISLRPILLKFLSGGEITKNIAYYFYFFFSESGEVAGIEDAFVMFNNLFGTELDFYVGQFQVSDPLFKRELRLTFEDYMVYKASPGSSRRPDLRPRPHCDIRTAFRNRPGCGGGQRKRSQPGKSLPQLR